jgi:hypothetical protein
MICKKCNNKKSFQALVTYYEPVEIWEFNAGGQLTRFNQPETGDLEVKLSCPVCNGDQIEAEGFDIKTFVESPLQRLDGEQWEAKVKECEQKG